MNKKHLFLFAALLLTAALLCPAAYARADSPLTARVSTDRDSYSRGDLITVTVTVTNASGYNADRVRIEALVPDGCRAADGSSPVLEAPVLAPGAALTHTCMFRLEKAVNPPVTGDRTPLALLIALSALSLAVFFAASPRRGRKVTVLILALGLSAASATAENTALRVSRTVAFEGGRLEIAALITCTAAPSPAPDPGEVSIVFPEKEHLHALGGTFWADCLIDLTAAENAGPEKIRALAAEYGASVAGMIAVTGDYQLLFPEAMSLEEINALCERLRLSDAVDSAVPEIFEPVSADTQYIPDDALWQPDSAWSTLHPSGSNWNVEAIHAPEAWNYVLNSAHVPVSIGIIDGMFDPGHEDLEGQFAEVWNNGEPLTSDHGTHVSGIIGAAFGNGKGIAGIVPDARLYAYSILGTAADENVTDPDKTFVNEYQYKYAVAKMVLSGCRVINVSMGASTPGGCAWQDEIDPFLTRLRNRGLDFLIVQSAGNSGIDASQNGIFVNCEASRSRIIVAAAADLKDDSPRYAVRPSGNWGARVDLVAPGQNILSCAFTESGYSAKSGTSMAAPHIAAIAALCYSVNPALTGEQVKDILLRSAPFSLTHMPSGADEAYTYPFADAFLAVEAACATAGAEGGPADFGTVMGRVVPRDARARVTAYTRGGQLSDTAEVMGDGQFSLLLGEGTYDLAVSLEGYRTLTVKSVAVHAGKITYLEDIILIRNTETDTGTVIGSVVDAVTGLPVAGAAAVFFPGWNSVGADAAGQCVSDGAGAFSLTLPAGHYTAVLSLTGYASARMNLTVLAGETTILTGALSPRQGEAQYRVVLTWGPEPADLDSHLSGILSDGSGMHVYYRATAAKAGGVTVSTLDHDDTTAYGPETVTLYIPMSGVFRYSVHNYTYRKDTANNNLANSGALAAVYRGNTLISVFPVPDRYGTVWNVFEIRNGEVIPLNTMEYETDPALVGIRP